MERIAGPVADMNRELDMAMGNASADATLAADYARCAEITRRSSSNFYYAFMLLPAERRRALYAVYAFCRFVDDVADDESTATRAPCSLDGARNSPASITAPRAAASRAR